MASDAMRNSTRRFAAASRRLVAASLKAGSRERRRDTRDAASLLSSLLAIGCIAGLRESLKILLLLLLL